MAGILVFPSGMPRSLEFARRAIAEGHEIVGASSIPNDPSRDRYPRWAWLPMVTDDGFHAALDQVLRDHGIASIYTPNSVVWHHLQATLPGLHPGVRLVNEAPLDTELAPYRAAAAFAADVLASSLPIPHPGTPADPCDELAARTIFRHAETIPGMCDHEKIRALFEVFRSLPKGDVVEIGTAWGKSAFVLHALARRFGVGPLLCVDPWADGHTIQKDEKGLVDSTRHTLTMQEAFEAFLVNLPPYAERTANYLRLPSLDAVEVYQRGGAVTSTEFGTVELQGRIALLHVDGNHSYESARADVRAWTPSLADGGWLVVDDYVWPFGDGPRRAGDEFLAEHRGRIDCAFVMGSALFARRAG